MWTRVQVPAEARDARFPGPGVTGGCELPVECWQLNLDSLEEQYMVLTAKTLI